MATSIEVDNFITPHGKGEGGGGGTTIVMGGKNNSVPANLNVNTINATTGNIQNLTGRSMTFNDASFIYLVSENGTIAKLNGNDLKYENGSIKSITSDSIDTGKLKTTDLEATNATIDNIISKNITTEYLTVTKQAHFFELVIDKIKSVGGQIILTPASCIADYVIPDPDHAAPLYYDVYFRATDEVNREITNDWRVDDQAICQNFNNAGIGHSYNVSNKYYWRLVTGILDDVYINFRTGQKLPYNTTDAHDYTSANIWNICLGANDVNTGNHIDYKTEFGSEPGGDPYYPADPDTEGYTKRSLLDNVDIAPMKLNGLPMAGWTDKTEDEDPMIGEMRTRNTIFGIQITPKEGYQLDGAILNNIELSTAEATRLNIGVYYVDGSSQYFPATLEGTRHYDYELNANTNVEAIIITNSDEPDWHLCHGIQLGNDNSDTDDPQVDVNYNPYSATVPSIPEAGDNIIQLGYRYNKYSPGESEYDVKRASAIIIASYHTPDSGINPPSYAQYKKITEFKLAKYRHTYFDADGSKFYGNFYIGPDDSDPDDYVPISDLEAEVYKIVPSDDVITKDINDKITPPTLTCSFIVPKEENAKTVVPPNCVFKWYIDNAKTATGTITAGNAVQIQLSNISNNITMVLSKDNYILDQITKTVVLIDVASGQDGSYTQWIYKYLSKDTTSVDLSEYDGQEAIPTGWSLTQPERRPVNTYLWYATRLVTYDQTNNPDFSDHWVAARLQGADGPQGPAGPQGSGGTQGSTGPQGPTGAQGDDGAPPVEYRLVDVNSYANVQMSLDPNDNNNIKQTLNLYLMFRVMRCIGDDIQYLKAEDVLQYGSEYGKNVYYRMSKSSSSTDYKYYKLDMPNTGSNYAEFMLPINTSTGNRVATFTNDRILNDNNNIIIAFVQNTTSPINDNNITSSTVYDTTNVSVTLQSGATRSILQGHQGGIARIDQLVTGQNGLQSQFSLMSQTMGQISQQVTTISSDYVNHSELTQTSEQIKSEVISEVSDQLPVTFIKTIDLTQLNNSYWYPVGITLEPNNTENQRIVIERPLLIEYGQPDYGSDLDSKPASENRGFSLICDWITRWSGWGANWGPADEEGGDSYEPYIYDSNQNLYVRQNWLKAECNGYGLDKYRYINDYKPHWTRVVDGIPKDCLAGSIRQNYQSNEEFIYLRGGSKYDVKTGWDGTQVKVYVTSSEYNNVSSSERPAYWTVGYTDTASGHTRHVLQRIINYEDLILPVKDAMKRSEIIQTADNIQLNVYNDLKQTGINITNGQIDLNANNTNIFGNLNLKNSTDGIILYDSNGNARVNILPRNIPDPNTSGGFDSRNYVQFYSAEVTKSNISENVDARTSRPSIGYLQANTTITFDIEPGIYGIASSINSYIANNIPSITAYFYIYNSSGTVISSTSTTLYRSGSTGSYTYPSFTHTYTFSNAGYYSIEMRLSGNDSNDRYTKYTINAFVDYNKKVDSLTYVGLDGVLVGTAKTKYAKISKDEYEFRWIDQLDNKSDAIKMSANGLQRVYNFDTQNGPLSWVGISGYKPVTIVNSSNVTLINTSNRFYAGGEQITSGYYYLVQPNDCNIMIIDEANSMERSPLYIRLTDGIGSTDGYPMAGRCIYIRSFRDNEDIYVVHGDKTYYNGSLKKVILSRNNKTGYTNKQQIHDDTYMFMAIPDRTVSSNEIAHWAIYSQFT